MRKRIILFVFVLALIAGLLRFRTVLAIYYNNHGLNSLEQGDYAGAISYFTKTLALVPNLAQTHYNLGVAYAEIKEYRRAVGEYLKAIEINPEYIKARFNLALIYYEQMHMYEESSDELKEILSINPEYKRAKEWLDKINLDYSATSLNSGLDYLKQGRFKEAEREFNRVLAIKPDFSLAKYNLALLYLKRGEIKRAILALKEIIKDDPSNVFAVRQLASIYFDLKDFKKALVFYRRVAGLTPQDIQAHNDLAQVLTKLGKYSEAIREFKTALKLKPDNLNLLYSLASTYRDEGDYEKAIFYYKRLQSLSPDYPFVHTELAGIYAHLNMQQEKDVQLRQAIDEYRADLVSHPRDIVSLNHLAEAYLQIGEIDLAKGTIERLFRIRDDYAAAYLTYAYILESLGDKKKARAYFEKAKKDPRLSESKRESIKKIIRNRAGENKQARAEDIIYLKNGRKIEGTVIKQTEEEIVLGVIVGNTQGTLTISKREIEKIEHRKEH